MSQIEYSIIGASSTDGASSGFLVPILSDGCSLFTQIVIDKYERLYHLKKMGPVQIDVKLSETPIKPFTDQIVVLAHDSHIKFFGYLTDLSQLVGSNQIEIERFPVAVKLQIFDLIDEEVKAAEQELSIMKIIDENSMHAAKHSFARSSSRAAFIKIGEKFLKRRKELVKDINYLLELSKYVEDWTLDSIDTDQRQHLAEIMTVDLVDFEFQLTQRKPTEQHYLFESKIRSSTENYNIDEIRSGISSLSRQERRIGKLLSEINEKFYISEEIIKNYPARANFERVAVKIISDILSSNQYAEFGRDFYYILISRLVNEVYPSRKGMLIKDLSREIGHIPAANQVLREILRSREYLWSVHIWADVALAYLEGQQLNGGDEWKIQSEFLKQYRSQHFSDLIRED